MFMLVVFDILIWKTTGLSSPPLSPTSLLITANCPSAPHTLVCDLLFVLSHTVTIMESSLLLCPCTPFLKTRFYPFSLVVFFRSWVCPPSPLRTPVLPPPQPLPLPSEPPRLTSPAGAHRVPSGLPSGRHHASVCLTHATPLGYCSLAATHHIDYIVLIYHWFSIFH